VILGAGGAARAIVDSLVDQGANSIAVLGRSEANVRQIVSRHPNVVDHMVLYRPVDMIVNTTPVQGRAPDASLMQGVSRDTIAVDITYEPRMSPWLAQHAQYGCRHTNGLAMLAYQSARQMNWWWGSHLDGATLLKALA
jgi:shikimate dehydrogenase